MNWIRCCWTFALFGNLCHVYQRGKVFLYNPTCEVIQGLIHLKFNVICFLFMPIAIYIFLKFCLSKSCHCLYLQISCPSWLCCSVLLCHCESLQVALHSSHMQCMRVIHCMMSIIEYTHSTHCSSHSIFESPSILITYG